MAKSNAAKKPAPEAAPEDQNAGPTVYDEFVEKFRIAFDKYVEYEVNKGVDAKKIQKQKVVLQYITNADRETGEPISQKYTSIKAQSSDWVMGLINNVLEFMADKDKNFGVTLSKFTELGKKGMELNEGEKGIIQAYYFNDAQKQEYQAAVEANGGKEPKGFRVSKESGLRQYASYFWVERQAHSLDLNNDDTNEASGPRM